MCGITGLWDPQHRQGVVEAERAAIRRMTGALEHRGPDDEGYFHDDGAGLTLGHRRLSIVDLSPLGRQPMTSASGRYVISFNGEIYNHRPLRQELESGGTGFHGRSDTEVMLAAIERWGLERALRRFIGMFAFALWDREERAVTLARDRLGIKPLYYGWTGPYFVFGSELKALRASPGFANPVNRDALTLLLRHNYIPAPYSIYRGIHKLMPGTLLRLDSEQAVKPADVDELTARATVYWSARQVVETSAGGRVPLGVEAATEELDHLLRDAVSLRMEADVPVGAFLSGGVDSSTVVALMQKQSHRPVRTYSIGFHEGHRDEAQHAKAVAEHLGTAHTELYVTPRETLDVIPRLPQMYDEPFADVSQIPTFLVSQLARRDVTVSLSGDGGDELFAGYTRYSLARRRWQRSQTVPRFLRHALARSLRAAPDAWGTVLNRAIPLFSSRPRGRPSQDSAARLADIMSADSPDALYAQLVSQWPHPAALVLGGHEPPTAFTDPARRAALDEYIERMMYTDLISYLPDDILTKVDRASMAVSLEARVPLLDHRVVEFAWRLPLTLKIRERQSKWLLRQVLYRYVPKALTDRRKSGFGLPIEHWLRGPLRDWGEALLDERRLREEGFFDPAPIRAMWNDHVAGRSSDHYRLWGVLMFQAWLEAQEVAAVPSNGFGAMASA